MKHLKKQQRHPKICSASADWHPKYLSIRKKRKQLSENTSWNIRFRLGKKKIMQISLPLIDPERDDGISCVLQDGEYKTFVCLFVFPFQ